MTDAVVVLSSPSDSEDDNRGDDGAGSTQRTGRRAGVVRPGAPLRSTASPARNARVDELFATQVLSAAHKDDVVVIDDDDRTMGDSQSTQDPAEDDDDDEVPETPGDTVLVEDSDDEKKEKEKEKEDKKRKAPAVGGSLAERLHRASVAEARRQQQQQSKEEEDDVDDLLADTQELSPVRLHSRPFDAFYRPTGSAPDAFSQLTGYRSTQAPRHTVTRTAGAPTPKPVLPRTGTTSSTSSNGHKAGKRELAMLSGEQRAVLEHALAGDSFFFTGAAGTGKSFLLRCIITALQAKLGTSHVFVTARFVFSNYPHTSHAACTLTDFGSKQHRDCGVQHLWDHIALFCSLLLFLESPQQAQMTIEDD